MSVAPVELDQPKSGEHVTPAMPWVAIVWNDPVNLMSYVTYVFQQVFGYSRKKAERLMLDVHHKGKAVVAAVVTPAVDLPAWILTSSAE